jgi:hypothetical protein
VKSCLENRDYRLRGSAALTMRSLYPPKLALTSPRSGGRSVGIVRSRTKATELVITLWMWYESVSLNGAYFSSSICFGVRST